MLFIDEDTKKDKKCPKCGKSKCTCKQGTDECNEADMDIEHESYRLEQYQEEFEDPNDMDNDLSKISTENLKLVYNDLSKRKYGFQFKTAPKDHIKFMENLKDELSLRTA